MVEEFSLGFGGVGGRVGGVDAGDDDVVFVAGMEAGLLERSGHAAKHLGAEHLAFEVDEREHRRAFAEVCAERGVVAGFVAEVVGEGQGMVEVLVDAGVLEVFGLVLRGRAEGFLVGGVLLGLGGDCGERQGG